MATVNNQNIYIGAPDQSVTGAVLTAPIGTTLPTDAISALDGAFESSGYVTEDGFSLEADRTTTSIRDWSRKVVRTITEEVSATVNVSMLELSEEALEQAFGASAVTAVAATATHGKQLKVEVTGDMPEPMVWAFNMKDGDRRVRVVLHNAQVTSFPSFTFNAGEAIVVPIEITCNADANGVLYTIFTDDGVTA